MKHNSVGHIFVKPHLVDLDATKIEKKTIFESQDSISDVVKTTHEGFVPVMVEQFEKNIAHFL